MNNYVDPEFFKAFEGMTRQNKSFVANMSGGTCIPRVNPLTLISQISVNLNSKIQGGNHA